MPVVYNIDGINPVFVDQTTGEVWQKDKPRGGFMLPEISIIGESKETKLQKAKKQFEKKQFNESFKWPLEDKYPLIKDIRLELDWTPGNYKRMYNDLKMFGLIPETQSINGVTAAVVNPAIADIADLGGGYMLKTLLRGAPIEKQLSKLGTININSLNAYINKASNMEQEVMRKVLQDKFKGQTHINYNDFRKAVQDELIGTYNRVPQTGWSDYGIDGWDLDLDKLYRDRIFRISYRETQI